MVKSNGDRGLRTQDGQVEGTMAPSFCALQPHLRSLHPSLLTWWCLEHQVPIACFAVQLPAALQLSAGRSLPPFLQGRLLTRLPASSGCPLRPPGAAPPSTSPLRGLGGQRPPSLHSWQWVWATLGPNSPYEEGGLPWSCPGPPVTPFPLVGQEHPPSPQAWASRLPH